MQIDRYEKESASGKSDLEEETNCDAREIPSKPVNSSRAPNEEIRDLIIKSVK